MTVALEVTADARIAVLHGVDSEAALQHLAVALVGGSVFAGYRGLVIDLGGRRPLPKTTAALAAAGEARLRCHQVVVTCADQHETLASVTRVRSQIERFDDGGAQPWISTVVRDLSWLFSVATVSGTIVGNLLKRLVTGLPRP